MQWELLSESEQERSYLLVFSTGEEVSEQLESFAAETGITAGHFTAIGAFSRLKLAYFDWEQRAYHDIPVDEQVEVLMLAGDLSVEKEKASIHSHVVVGRSDGTTRGGHLKQGWVRPTLELVLISSPRYLQRTYDPASRLFLIDLNSVMGHRIKK